MVRTETRYEHMSLDERNIPIITETTMKVQELVVSHLAYGWSPEELHFQYPYLSLGQIYSALAYYWDHQKEIDQGIEQMLRAIDAVRQSMGPSPLVARLKDMGLL